VRRADAASERRRLVRPPIQRRLRRAFYDRGALEVAPDLLGKVLVGPGVAARLVEVEAYLGAEDPGSHGYRGMTPRTEVMFGPPGFLYVYFTYGMHFCANVVTAPRDKAGAVLLRGAEPLVGRDLMAQRRRGRADLCSGPAKLSQAFGLERSHNGLDLCARNATVYIADDGTGPLPHTITKRIGLSTGRGDELLYRFLAVRS